MTTNEERIPVIVGAGQINQRVDQGAPVREPYELMVDALRAAADDAGASSLVTKADSVRAVNVFGWQYRDPARLVAAELGCDQATTMYTHIGGNVPQVVVNGACNDIASGAAEIVFVAGGEAGASKARAKRAGETPAWTVQDPDASPDGWADSDLPLLLDTEMMRGVLWPIQIYPMFESAWRAANGWSLEENRARIARVTAALSDVSVDNPHAWNRVAQSAASIDSPENGNRMVGFPYRKVVNSFERVDQGAGLIITSLAKAKSLGISSDRFVFPLAGTEGLDSQYMSNRASFADSPSMRIAGRLALQLAGVDPHDLTHVDVYSCFPVAVQLAAHEFGLSIDRQLTVTGGLPFAGGPWSNYVSHSIARTVELLRESGGTGLVTANGGFFTKHAFGVYATEPSANGFAWAKPQDEIDAVGSLAVAEGYDGAASVESCTVMHDRDDNPEKAIITALTPDGRRAWGTSTNADAMDAIESVECVGRGVVLAADGSFEFVG